MNNLRVGKLYMCWYFSTAHNNYNDMDFFYCKILELGDEYSKCRLYWGEEPDKIKSRGVFEDVCTADIIEIK